MSRGKSYWATTGLLALAAAAVLGLVLASSCAHEMGQAATAGRGVEVGRLFEHEGVVVYRFHDAGRYHYYAVDNGRVRSTFSNWSEACGKNCTRYLSEEIQTVVSR